MKLTKDMKPKTKFGRWLLDEMNDSGYSCQDVAKELMTTRQNVRHHINGITEPSFAWVIAYCWLFDKMEYLDVVYGLIKKEA